MEKIQLISFAICLITGLLGGFDFIVYTVKKAPKSSSLNPFIWKLSFASWILIIYWILNGMKLF